MYNKIVEAAQYIEQQIKMKPQIGVILGSGLGDLAEQISNPTFINYDDIPHFPKASHVVGHKNRFVIGEFQGKSVIMMQGRFHFYEGFAMKDIVLPVYVMKYLGATSLIVTNACGAVNKSFNAGDLMLIDDHINYTFDNPLRGLNIDEMGTRFPDMSQAYNKEYQALAETIAKSMSLSLQHGVYLMYPGPNYETPAEIRAFRLLGADAVGMSTVPEVIAASHCGMKVLGVSCLTNMAAGVLDQPLNHEEVLETSTKVKDSFQGLITKFIADVQL